MDVTIQICKCDDDHIPICMFNSSPRVHIRINETMLDSVEKEQETWERVGHFLSNSMLSFRLNYFLVQPLVQRPFHSPTYLCVLQWQSPLNHLPSFGTFPYMFASSKKNCYNLNHQSSRVLSSLHIGKVLPNIQSLHVQVKKCMQSKMNKLKLKNFALHPCALYF